jgi:hypothetical protein
MVLWGPLVGFEKTTQCFSEKDGVPTAKPPNAFCKTIGCFHRNHWVATPQALGLWKLTIIV